MSGLYDYLSFKRHPGHLSDLDGLRGIAVILVLFRHAAKPFWTPEQSLVPFLGWDFGIFMINGWIGVDLFFVLSGFLITSHIIRLKEKNTNIWSWKPYLAKRALRIIPAYFAVLFIAVAGLIPFFDISPNLIELRTLYHLLFLQDYLPANIVVSFWSLGVEEKFYLVAPFLVAFLLKCSSLKQRVLGISFLLLACLGFRILTAFEYPDIEDYTRFFYKFRSPFHLTLDPILIGVLLALVYERKDHLPKVTAPVCAKVVFWLGATAFILLTATSDLMQDISWWDKTLQPSLIALACGAMTFGLLFGGGIKALFRSYSLFFFARISYSLYLIHLPLVPLAQVLTQELSLQTGEFFAFCIIFFSLSIICALILHYLIEKPFLLIKDRIKFVSPKENKPRTT